MLYPLQTKIIMVNKDRNGYVKLVSSLHYLWVGLGSLKDLRHPSIQLLISLFPPPAIWKGHLPQLVNPVY